MVYGDLRLIARLTYKRENFRQADGDVEFSTDGTSVNTRDGGREMRVGKAKFPEHWYDKLAKAFDKYLSAYDPSQLDKGLFDLYKAWRDGCKIRFNRVDLAKLEASLEDRAAFSAGHMSADLPLGTDTTPLP